MELFGLPSSAAVRRAVLDGAAVLLEADGTADLGRLGVTDRWHDLADALWSVTRNLGPGWGEAFLAAYGVARDPATLDFFGLLGHLLP